jgi:hypothetical protein
MRTLKRTNAFFLDFERMGKKASRMTELIIRGA